MLFPSLPAGRIDQRTTRRPRRGATAMEYLFMLSSILIVAIWAIGSLGQTVRSSSQDSADKISSATAPK